MGEAKARQNSLAFAFTAHGNCPTANENSVKPLARYSQLISHKLAYGLYLETVY